ncbi:phosphotransferase [Umezawaea sp. Da 62-37]|uniref:phosphotransferase n=1 Tax=Umezawaea sp. Da 62-37 TaxID=3075927 RepID=UPI0028F6FB25|nr:phosphotransferase [Umezawaea sp. Da 62-37]WNV86641.1 phosphotransferase [Umezawaea sp. Da 62-37]WNV86776.1 phosphotransferase [Umezawaea sp. Da 62-37]
MGGVAGHPGLEEAFPWAAERVGVLIGLEQEAVEVARGDVLVHFDLFAHNVVVGADRVVVVDWPHARRGARFVDPVMLLSSVDGVDGDRVVAGHPSTAGVPARSVDAVLAAHAGFCVAGALTITDPRLAVIREAKVRLAGTALEWLGRRWGR